MKKNTKLFLIILAAALVLTGALVTLLLLGNDEENNPTDDIDPGADFSVSTNDEGIYEAIVNTDKNGAPVSDSYGTLLEKTPFDLTQVDIENESGSFSILAKTEKVASTNEDGEEEELTDQTVYTLVGYESFTLASTVTGEIGSAAATLEFTKVTAVNPATPADFGLEKPRATVTVKYEDGTSSIIKIGNNAPSSAGVYIQFGTLSTVYLVAEDSIKPFLYDFTQMFDLTINTSAQSDENAKFEYVRLSGSAFPEKLEIKNNKDAANSAYYILSSHNNLFVSATEGSSVTGTIRGLYADEVVCVNPTDAQLKEYGLNSPYAVLEAKYPDAAVHLKASKPDGDKNVYLMDANKKIIYKLSAAAVPWVETSYEQLLSEYILYPASDLISGITINHNAKTYTFDVTTTTKNVTDDEGQETTVSETVVKYNGKELTLSNFEQFTRELVSIKHSDVATDSPTGNALLTVTYSYSNNRSDDTVKFYNHGDAYLATVNGTTIGTVTKSTVDVVTANISKVAENKSIS